MWTMRPEVAASAAEEAAAGTFELSGGRRTYDGTVDWRDADVSRLDRFALSSFGFAWPMAASDPGRHGPALARLIKAWHEGNPPRRGDPWHPFVVAERLINLIGTMETWLPYVEANLVESLRRQARYLGASVEWDVGGNHVVRELSALVLASAAFGDGALWSRSLTGIRKEIERQILPDGGHLERSPAYHMQVLTDLVEVESCLPDRHPARSAIEAVLPGMARFAVSLCHPDGQLAMFNDCYEWPVLPSEYLARLGLAAEPSTTFPDCGYHVFGSDGDRLFFDAGPPSPPDLPPHAHCDLLSIEVSAGGERMIVNSGTGDYERGEWRDYWRSTRAHNTVEIDGAEQSEVWHSFRMARRASPLDVLPMASGESRGLTAAHDGYRRLPRPAVHRRTVVWSQGAWAIVDGLEGSGEHRVRSFLHLHPDVVVRREGASVVLGRGAGDLRVTPLGSLELTVAEARTGPIANWYASHLGERRPARALVLEGRVAFPSTVGWFLQPEGPEPELGLESTPHGFRLTVDREWVVEKAGRDLAVRSLR
jgi:uncharacterized heparinase superfamily protein